MQLKMELKILFMRTVIKQHDQNYDYHGNTKMDSFARIELFDLMTLQKLALIDPFLWMEKS